MPTGAADWPSRRPRAPQPGSADQAARLSETAIAFARLCLCGVETVVAFVGAGRAVTETGGAFAAEKWAFWVRFSAAEVMVVSMVAVQGRAVVMVVSCWPASVAAEVSLVSKSPCRASCARKSSPCSVRCGCEREKVRPAHEKWPKICVCGVLGELFREYTAGWGTLGGLFRACCGKGRHSDGFFVE